MAADDLGKPWLSVKNFLVATGWHQRLILGLRVEGVDRLDA